MSDSKDNLRGILLMVASMATFALEDMFIKVAAGGLPAGQILLMLGLAGTPVFAAMVRRAGMPVFTRAALHPAVLLRNAGEMVGSMGFVTALALIPLTTATAIFQAMPLFVTMGAALFLGEVVGWRRWTAVIVGFVGVLIIIRPGGTEFTPALLWPLLAVAGLGLRDLATRRIPGEVSTMQLATWGFVAVAILGAGMLLISGGGRLPDGSQALALAGALSCGLGASWALTEASRIGEVSVITPFRYSRLVFGLMIGITVFGERPDFWTWVGASIIIGAGLYTFARERARNRALPMKSPPG
jgi:drug/metabolite transporter (DMT)-like permease